MSDDILLELIERLVKSGLSKDSAHMLLAGFLEEMTPIDFYDQEFEIHTNKKERF